MLTVTVPRAQLDVSSVKRPKNVQYANPELTSIPISVLDVLLKTADSVRTPKHVKSVTQACTLIKVLVKDATSLAVNVLAQPRLTVSLVEEKVFSLLPKKL